MAIPPREEYDRQPSNQSRSGLQNIVGLAPPPPKKFAHKDVTYTLARVFDECANLLSQGQKEYAGQESTPFGNFERLSADLEISRETVLLVYAKKHVDGIHSYVKGHRSQREDVRGRINDLIVYMVLLRAMLDESSGYNISSQ